MHDVEAGATLAEALGKHPTVFDTLFVQHGRRGRGGRYPRRHPAAGSPTYLEKAEALKRKVKSAMTYPVGRR